MGLGVAALALTMAVLGVVWWSGQLASPRTTSNKLLEHLQVSQITTSGNAWRPALSPDGRYVVYVRRDGLDHSLRMRQLGTDRDVELVPAQPGLTIQAATVTPDGSFVDFVRGEGSATLWRVPFLGGGPKRLIDNVNSPIGWSPDSRRLAFVRSGSGGSSALIVAESDGTSPKTIAASRTSSGHPTASGSRSARSRTTWDIVLFRAVTRE